MARTKQTKEGPKASFQADRRVKTMPRTFSIPWEMAFYLCLFSHGLAALYAPIQDCDETFNYWEPLHYVVHNYGLQTWEYSPEYSIRSWAYVMMHAVPTKLVTLVGIKLTTKTFEFYLLRVLLATVCAATETRLYSAISKNVNPRVGAFYLLIVAFTPGVFSASAAFLPSSFAMYTSSLALAEFLDHRHASNTARGIMWFAVGALLGWPFAGALILPFVVTDVLDALITEDVPKTVERYSAGIKRSLAVLAVQVIVDSLCYRKLVVVAWRIVSYNVFSGTGKGPDIFGTEPWHFYIRNLALNFNLWALLAFASAPLLLLQALRSGPRVTSKSRIRTAILATPFYLWVAVFTVQPHKEERFMYPAYPFLALNAAMALHVILVWAGHSDPGTLSGKVPARLKVIAVLLPTLLAINVGLLRILGTVTAYRAPLQVLEALSTETNITSDVNVCVGKEWYRFPSSFFLPNGSHAKFVKSEFDGLLPGEFFEGDGALGFLTGAPLTPSGMNDRNEEDPNKLTSIDKCSYLIDSQFPSSNPTALEPDYLASRQWEKVSCYPFLDTASTHILARTVWVPETDLIPAEFRRSWGEFCLLKRR